MALEKSQQTLSLLLKQLQIEKPLILTLQAVVKYHTVTISAVTE